MSVRTHFGYTYLTVYVANNCKTLPSRVLRPTSLIYLISYVHIKFKSYFDTVVTKSFAFVNIGK